MFLDGKKVYVAMLIPGSSYASDLKEELESKGAKVVMSSYGIYDADNKTGILRELETEKPDAVFIYSPDLTKDATLKNCEAVLAKVEKNVPVIVREANIPLGKGEKKHRQDLPGAVNLPPTTPDEALGFVIADAIKNKSRPPRSIGA